MPTVREIARRAGVSKTTVSMVLNNREGVSENMGKRVQDAIYDMRVLATQSVSYSTAPNSPKADKEEKNLNMLVLHPANIRSSSVFHEILRGIQAAASLYHVQLNLAFNEPDLIGDNVINLYFMNPVLKPGGVLVIGAKINEPVVEQARLMNIPIVLVGRPNQLRGVNAVSRDEEPSAFEATSHLINLGHRNIAFLGGSSKYSYTKDRLNGYRRALETHKIHYCEQRVLLGFDELSASRLLLHQQDITGAVIINELYANRLLPQVKAGGRQIPADLSVVTFDDSELSRTFDPPLTSISFPFYQEGFWAVRLLMEQIRQPILLSLQVMLRSSLVRRESSCPPKSVLHEAIPS
jgi:DNA-binding LacI/PurR family transcriptional regulator